MRRNPTKVISHIATKSNISHEEINKKPIPEHIDHSVISLYKAKMKHSYIPPGITHTGQSKARSGGRKKKNNVESR